MTYTRLVQSEYGFWWSVPLDASDYTTPVRLTLCPACGSVVFDEEQHTNWHEQIEETKS